jgi:hypothetical protein
LYNSYVNFHAYRLSDFSLTPHKDSISKGSKLVTILILNSGLCFFAPYRNVNVFISVQFEEYGDKL